MSAPQRVGLIVGLLMIAFPAAATAAAGLLVANLPVFAGGAALVLAIQPVTQSIRRGHKKTRHSCARA